MDVGTFPEEDRVILLGIFRQFRSHDAENDSRGYSDRDELERKLQHRGWVNGLDRHLLRVAVAHEAPERFDYFKRLLGE